MHKIFLAQKSYCACRVLSLATIRSKYYVDFILNVTRSGRELFDRPSYIRLKPRFQRNKTRHFCKPKTWVSAAHRAVFWACTKTYRAYTWCWQDKCMYRTQSSGWHHRLVLSAWKLWKGSVRQLLAWGVPQQVVKTIVFLQMTQEHFKGHR